MQIASFDALLEDATKSLRLPQCHILWSSDVAVNVSISLSKKYDVGVMLVNDACIYLNAT